MRAWSISGRAWCRHRDMLDHFRSAPPSCCAYMSGHQVRYLDGGIVRLLHVSCTCHLWSGLHCATRGLSKQAPGRRADSCQTAVSTFLLSIYLKHPGGWRSRHCCMQTARERYDRAGSPIMTSSALIRPRRPASRPTSEEHRYIIGSEG
nr:hypothetical protein CFP56_76408 [Quercus suber]